MKTIITRFFFYFISVVTLTIFQSCGGVYNSTNLALESALETDKPLKVRTTEGDVFKINRLERDETGIYGIARKESNTARKNKESIIENDYQGKYVKMEIPEKSIEEKIRTKNKALSIVLPITIGVAIIAFVISNIVVMP